ncbi:unnamed protein product [Pleuronectes platessa]|uniref:Uncharacterized protein n=1 Tax=Pleuronectes platessa TaxID=8262 RepID=A0A9N7YAF5_PLEPL|nr:unnamed protein product [Pleuronectes platessa]
MGGEGAAWARQSASRTSCFFVLSREVRTLSVATRSLWTQASHCTPDRLKVGNSSSFIFIASENGRPRQEQRGRSLGVESFSYCRVGAGVRLCHILRLRSSLKTDRAVCKSSPTRYIIGASEEGGKGWNTDVSPCWWTLFFPFRAPGLISTPTYHYIRKTGRKKELSIVWKLEAQCFCVSCRLNGFCCSLHCLSISASLAARDLADVHDLFSIAPQLRTRRHPAAEPDLRAALSRCSSTINLPGSSCVRA